MKTKRTDVPDMTQDSYSPKSIYSSLTVAYSMSNIDETFDEIMDA